MKLHIWIVEFGADGDWSPEPTIDGRQPFFNSRQAAYAAVDHDRFHGHRLNLRIRKYVRQERETKS